MNRSDVEALEKRLREKADSYADEDGQYSHFGKAVAYRDAADQVTAILAAGYPESIIRRLEVLRQESSAPAETVAQSSGDAMVVRVTSLDRAIDDVCAILAQGVDNG